MQFNSFGYALFLIIIFCIYWVIPSKKRWIALLIFSYYFYMSWEPKYVILILLSTWLSYIFAILIDKKENSNEKKRILFWAVFLIILILFIFKYFNFFSASLSVILKQFALPISPISLKLFLPVGISFYTFQTLSYLIDVYRGDMASEKHFGYYALYVSFFPQLVAGPIERPQNLLPQLKANLKFDYKQASGGLQQIAIGLFKKMVISNTLAGGVDLVYNNLQFYSGFVLIIATILFTYQLYCDFSGYSDIAIGSAKLLNINLMENFNAPFFAQSINEFWNRWHISLSRWLRDYVYIPLGGNRCSKIRYYRNIMITNLLSGLWHGAAWTFVIWGGLQGVFRIMEDLLNCCFSIFKIKKCRFKIVNRVIIFLLFCFSLIFFRANNLTDAIYIISNMFDGIMNPINYLKFAYSVPHAVSKIGMLILIIEFSVLFYLDFIQYCFGGLQNYLNGKKQYYKWVINVILVVLILLCSVKSAGGEFIYFQF